MMAQSITIHKIYKFSKSSKMIVIPILLTDILLLITTVALPNQANIQASKLLKHPRQQELVRKNPGSLMAVARALKMAIVECQYQMRHEPWDCPIYGFGVKPVDMFGKMMSRSFRETSFIHSLLSAALAHSITRACTDSLITTCGRKQTRESGYREDIEFGNQFAKQFMEATHELSASYAATNNNIDRNNSIILTGNSLTGSGSSSFVMEPSRRERRIRNLINAHNDEAGRLYILDGMRRDCKCHGLSGACTMQTCWLRLPPFREVASKLHDSLDRAIRVVYAAQYPTSRQKPLPSDATARKSNKKRSSVQPMNGLTRPSTSIRGQALEYPSPYASYPGNSLTSDTATIIGNRRRETKRHTNDSDISDDYYRSSSTNIINTGPSIHGETMTQQMVVNNNSTSVVKKRPVARSIGIELSTISPGKFDLLFFEDSPSFCEPDETYNIKGTKGRTCSDNPKAPNSCDRLCCKRGYKTEVREEIYKCKCVFKFCCDLKCEECKRRKSIHKCW